MRKFFRLMTAMTGWIVAATVLAPSATPADDSRASAWPDRASASGVAQVRFVNGLADDVAVEADQHLAFADVEYRRTTHYAEIGAQRARFVVRAMNGTTIASVEDDLGANMKYTLVAGRNAAGEPMLVVLPDREQDQVEAKADQKVMFIRAGF